MGSIAVIGGGLGGAAAARALKKQCGSEHQIIIVEQESQIYNKASLPFLSVGRRKREDLIRSSTALNRWGIQVVIDRATAIEPSIRRIQTEHREIRYDLAIIAAGAKHVTDAVPGMAAGGINLYSLEGAVGLPSRLNNFKGEEIAILAPSETMCYPLAPYEYALLLQNWFKRRGLSKDVSISLFCQEAAPLAAFGKKLSDVAAELLLRRSIHLHLNCQILRVNPEEKFIELQEGRFPYDLMLYCPPAAPPDILKESGLADDDGWLSVDPHSLVSQQEGIMGLGDVTRISALTGYLPKMGAVAYPQALTAASNAARLLQGNRVSPGYSGKVSFFFRSGKGAIPVVGNFYEGSNSFKVYPASRLWSTGAGLTEKRWKQVH